MTEIETLDLELDLTTGKKKKKKDWGHSADDAGQPTVASTDPDTKKTAPFKKEVDDVKNNYKNFKKDDQPEEVIGTKKSSDDMITSVAINKPTLKDQLINTFKLIKSNDLLKTTPTDDTKGDIDFDISTYKGGTSNLDLKSFALSGSNIFGQLMSKTVTEFLSMKIHEQGHNYVPELQPFAPKGVNVLRGGKTGSWCADFISIAMYQVGKNVDNNFNSEIANDLPKSQGALNLRDKFAEKEAYMSAAQVRKHLTEFTPENLTGLVVFYSRKTRDEATGELKNEGHGHADVIAKAEKLDDGDIMLTLVGGNVSNAVKATKIRLSELMNKESNINTAGTTKAKFEGFGDLSKVVEKTNPALYAYVEHKDDMDKQSYAANNRSSSPKVKDKTNVHEHV